MRPQPDSHLRVARPSRDLQAAERFWVGGLGLSVLYRAGSSAEGGHPPPTSPFPLHGGWPGAAWHLELVGDPAAPATPAEEDLLVLYLDGEADKDLVRRLIQAGGTRVPARNPYWDRWGVTIADPDGYRLVLSSRSWPDDGRR
jgi:catechol 2,3-dioxygenase-like lactoylglutathione lyase family enzyme